MGLLEANVTIAQAKPCKNRVVDAADKDADLRVEIDLYRCYMMDQWTRVFDNVTNWDGYMFLIAKSHLKTTALRLRVMQVSNESIALWRRNYTSKNLKGADMLEVRIDRVFTPILAQLSSAKAAAEHCKEDNSALVEIDKDISTFAKVMILNRAKMLGILSHPGKWRQYDESMEWFRDVKTPKELKERTGELLSKQKIEHQGMSNEHFANRAFGIKHGGPPSIKCKANFVLKYREKHAKAKQASIYDIVKGPNDEHKSKPLRKFPPA